MSLARGLGFQRLLGISLLHLGSLALDQNRLDGVDRHFEEGLQAVRAAGIVRQILSGLSSYGYALLRMGDLPAALARLHEGLRLERDSALPRSICGLQYNLAMTYLASDDLDAARSALRESLILAQNLGLRPEKVEGISAAVACFQRLGRNEQAAVWAGAIYGDMEIDSYLFEPVCSLLASALGSDAYQHALESGKPLSLDDVVAEAISSI